MQVFFLLISSVVTLIVGVKLVFNCNLMTASPFVVPVQDIETLNTANEYTNSYITQYAAQ